MRQIQKMSDAEAEVMQVVWHCGGSITSSALHQELSQTREWKQNTVITFLTRLTDKGIIAANKQGRGKPSLYVAQLTEEEYKHCETMTFLDAVHGGSVKSLMTALCGSEEPSRAQLNELKAWFENLDKG